MSASVSDVSLGNASGQENFTLGFTTEELSATRLVGSVEIEKGTTLETYTVNRSGSTNDTFHLRLTATLGTDGLLSYSHAFDDEATKTYTISSANEDTQIAQQIYFADIWSGVNSTTDVEASSLGLTDVSDDQFEVSVGINADLSNALGSELAAEQGETIVTSLQ